MKRLHQFLSITAIAVLFTACQTYDEGPHFTLQTVTARLTGTWSMQGIYENGVSSVQSDSYQYEFKKDGTFSALTNPGTQVWGNTGSWQLIDGKEKLRLDFANDTANIMRLYDIEKLTDTQLVLEDEYSDADTRIELNKK